MGKNFFEKIVDRINGTHSEGDSIPNDENKSSNSIDKKGDLLNAVVSALKPYYRGTKISLKERSLSLWIDDNLFYNSLILDKFHDVLITTIIDELGIEFGSIEINLGAISDSSATKIMDCCYLCVQPIMSVQVISKAIISQVPGNGSLIEECVNIDSQKIQELPGNRYNIGSGKHSIMSDNSHRENHIAVDDNPSSIEFDKNKYVSRAHAHISYDSKHGFLLHVEHGGTRAAQKRTHIHRGGEKIELNNILIPEPLQDGDYIVLSKYVHLLFKKV